MVLKVAALWEVLAAREVAGCRSVLELAELGQVAVRALQVGLGEGRPLILGCGTCIKQFQVGEESFSFEAKNRGFQTQYCLLKMFFRDVKRFNHDPHLRLSVLNILKCTKQFT